jgi:hypothetical protein
VTPSIGLDLGTYRGPNDRIHPRTQREAGIDCHSWEDRLKPRLSWAAIAARATMSALGLLAAIALLLHFMESYK